MCRLIGIIIVHIQHGKIVHPIVGNKCFRVIGSQRGDRKNYTDARDDCRASGGDIASINSHIELGRYWK